MINNFRVRIYRILNNNLVQRKWGACDGFEKNHLLIFLGAGNKTIFLAYRVTSAALISYRLLLTPDTYRSYENGRNL